MRWYSLQVFKELRNMSKKEKQQKHIIRCKKCKQICGQLLGDYHCNKCGWEVVVLIHPMAELNNYAYCSCGKPIGVPLEEETVRLPLRPKGRSSRRVS